MPKTVFLIRNHLKYTGRSNYALLHSSYLATPIHKMPYKAQCSIGWVCWDWEERTFKRRWEKIGCHWKCPVLLCYMVEKQNCVSFFFAGHPAATGNHFGSIYSGLHSCRSRLNTQLTSNPMNSLLRLLSVCVSFLGPLLSWPPIYGRSLRGAQTKTWCL